MRREQNVVKKIFKWITTACNEHFESKKSISGEVKTMDDFQVRIQELSPILSLAWSIFVPVNQLKWHLCYVYKILIFDNISKLIKMDSVEQRTVIKYLQKNGYDWGVGSIFYKKNILRKAILLHYMIWCHLIDEYASSRFLKLQDRYIW